MQSAVPPGHLDPRPGETPGHHLMEVVSRDGRLERGPVAQEHVRVVDLGALVLPIVDDRQRALLRKRKVEASASLVLHQRQSPVCPVDLVEPQSLDVPRPQPKQRREQHHRPVPQARLRPVAGLDQRPGNLTRPVDRRQDRVPVGDDHREHVAQGRIGAVLADRKPQIPAQEVHLASTARSGHRRKRTNIGGHVRNAERRHLLHPQPCQERQEPAQHPGLAAHSRLAQPTSRQRRRVRLELRREDLGHQDPPAPGPQREPACLCHIEQAAHHPAVEHLPLLAAVRADSSTEAGSRRPVRVANPAHRAVLPELIPNALITGTRTRRVASPPHERGRLSRQLGDNKHRRSTSLVR